MATLEKIRSKSVILFVIIIVALLAFILGDFLTSGRTYFGTGDKMAEANGAKVKLDEFNNYRAAQGENQQADPDVLEQQYLNQLLVEKLLEQECDEAGIKITDSELSQWMLNYDSEVRTFISQLSYAFQLNPAVDEQSMAANINQVLDRLKNPKKYQLPEDEAARLLNQWKHIEAQAETTLRNTLYTMMLEALYQPNDVDAQALYSGASNRQVDLVVLSTATVPDADVKVSDDDIKAVWTANQSKFKVKGDKRSLAYIVQPIQVTAEDLTAADNAVTELMATLNADTLITLDAVKGKSNFVTQTAKLTKAQINNNYVGANLSRQFNRLIDSAKVGKTVVIDARPGAYYVLGRLMGIENKVDSVTFSQIMYADAAMTDSLMTLAKATPVWDSIKGSDMVGVLGAEEVSLHNPSQNSVANVPKIANLLSELAVGEVVLYQDTIQGNPLNMLLRVDKRAAVAPVYDIARIDYVITPSNATRSKITGDFRNYLGNNSTTKSFVDNAPKAGYMVEYAMVGNGTPNIAGLPDTRRLVKFAMDGDKGKVSPMVESRIRQRQDNQNQRMPSIFQTVTPPEQDYLVAVALNDEYENYIPWNDPVVKPRLEAEARNLKKAQKLEEKYKNLLTKPEELAKAANTAVTPATYSFNSGRYPAEVAAAINKAADGAAPFAVVTPEGLFVVRVKSTTEPTMKLDDNKDIYLRNSAQMFNPFTSQFGFLNALLGDEELENNSLNFKQGFDD